MTYIAENSDRKKEIKANERKLAPNLVEKYTKLAPILVINSVKLAPNLVTSGVKLAPNLVKYV